ncbi:MAG: hypothetical protein NC416_10500 [Eubacterium sp.]|nr:hypothetical protein [Eubacterium sp.]
MKEKKTGRFRQYWIWIGLLAKRLWKQPAYIGLIVLIPLLGYAVGLMERDGQSGAVVTVCVEDGAWSRQMIEELRRLEEESVLKFEFCEDGMAVERSVMKSEADCGFVIGADIVERVKERNWTKTVIVYETSASSITGIAKERIGGVIFKLYSEQCYEDYMRAFAEGIWNTDFGMMPQEGTENAAVKDAADSEKDEFVRFAQEAYESHLVDNSTFGFEYENGDQNSQYSSDNRVITDTSVFPIKGVFAVVIFISGMCGMLEYDRDRQEKRFERIAPNRLTYIVDVWLPTIFVSLAVLLCLWISDGIRYCGGDLSVGKILSTWSVGTWAIQIGRLFIYQCIVVIYCGLLGILLKRQEAVAAAIPILSLGSLVCAPVFVRLATYLPVFAVLEKLFPVTYYLML